MSTANNAEPTIRLATEEDVSTILKFIYALAAYENATEKVEATPTTLLNTLSFPSSPPKTAGTYTALISPPPSPSDPSPTPVGMALFFYNYSTWRSTPGVYLEDFYVQEECRGCGYGRKLFEWLAREVVRVGGKRLEWSVMKGNYSSIRFYEKMGGVVGEEWLKMSVDKEALERLAEGRITRGQMG